MAEKEITTITKDVVVTLDYTLEVNGKTIDSGPIQFIQGHGNIISGLENEIEGMTLGDEKAVSVVQKMPTGFTILTLKSKSL